MTAAQQSDPGQVVVGMAELAVVRGPNVELVTYGLGSCVAVCVFDPVLGVAGLSHHVLPAASASPRAAAEKPAMFTDTGVVELFDRMFAHGCAKQNLVVKAAGCGSLLGGDDVFSIGERNYAVLCKLMEKNGIAIAAADVGGQASRTVRLSTADGTVQVTSMGRGRTL